MEILAEDLMGDLVLQLERQPLRWISSLRESNQKTDYILQSLRRRIWLTRSHQEEQERIYTLRTQRAGRSSGRETADDPRGEDSGGKGSRERRSTAAPDRRTGGARHRQSPVASGARRRRSPARKLPRKGVAPGRSERRRRVPGHRASGNLFRSPIQGKISPERQRQLLELWAGKQLRKRSERRAPLDKALRSLRNEVEEERWSLARGRLSAQRALDRGPYPGAPRGSLAPWEGFFPRQMQIRRLRSRIRRLQLLRLRQNFGLRRYFPRPRTRQPAAFRRRLLQALDRAPLEAPVHAQLRRRSCRRGPYGHLWRRWLRRAWERWLVPGAWTLERHLRRIYGGRPLPRFLGRILLGQALAQVFFRQLLPRLECNQGLRRLLRLRARLLSREEPQLLPLGDPRGQRPAQLHPAQEFWLRWLSRESGGPALERAVDRGQLDRLGRLAQRRLRRSLTVALPQLLVVLSREGVSGGGAGRRGAGAAEARARRRRRDSRRRPGAAGAGDAGRPQRSEEELQAEEQMRADGYSEADIRRRRKMAEQEAKGTEVNFVTRLYGRKRFTYTLPIDPVHLYGVHRRREPALSRWRRRRNFRGIPGATSSLGWLGHSRRLCRGRQRTQPSQRTHWESRRLPLVRYRFQQIRVIEENVSELRFLLLERTSNRMTRLRALEDYFDLLTPQHRLISIQAGRNKYVRYLRHMTKAISPRWERENVLFRWLREDVLKNEKYNLLIRNTRRKPNPKPRPILRPRRSNRLLVPFTTRFIVEFNRLLGPWEQTLERFNEYNDLLRIRRATAHYRWTETEHTTFRRSNDY